MEKTLFSIGETHIDICTNKLWFYENSKVKNELINIIYEKGDYII